MATEKKQASKLPPLPGRQVGPRRPLPPGRRFEFKFRFDLKRILLWLLVVFIVLSFVFSFVSPPPIGEEVPLSQVLADIKEGKVTSIEVQGEKLLVAYPEDKFFTSRKEPGQNLVEVLQAAGIDPAAVELVVADQSLSKIGIELLGTLLPLGLMAVFFFFILRQARGAQEGLFSFGRSRAKIFAKGRQPVSFADVAGVDEAKAELEEVVDFLKHPGKYRKLGARTPKGVLLVGPAGVGKTLLARAVAGEANVPFFSIAGSEFMEMLVGVGASRTRDLFSTAKTQAPSIIFIDEIDAIGRQRGVGLGGGHDEREQTLNQILVEMDGFTPNDNVVVVAATNRPDMLDPALLRPGRFDRRVMLDMPDIAGRKGILKIHARGKPFVKGVDWDKVAERTVGFSGADLENMLNEAAILAARDNKKAIGAEDIEESATKVKLGPEKKRVQSPKDKEMTAYHEAGHAIVAYNLPNMDPVHRVSIVSRGLALGFTLIPPKQDRYTETRSRLLEMITAALGGRAAEEIKFEEFTVGASSDIDRATRIARRMVIDYGMSRLGPVHLGVQYETSEAGVLTYEQHQVSQDMQAKVDGEIKRIVDDCYGRALEVLKKNKEELDQVAEILVKKETIEGDEFEKLMKGGVSKKG